MRHKVNPFLRIFLFAAVLVILAVIAAVGLFYYMFGIPEPEGLSLASWPHIFTDNFSTWMENENGKPVIEDTGIERLDEYGLWIQVLDETGKEVFSHHKPAGCPVSYSASRLTALGTDAFSDGSTVFVSSFEDSGQTFSYLIGFPYAIGKHMLYYNGEHVGRLWPAFRLGICFTAGFIIICTFAYGFWLTGHLAKITGGIADISCRSYLPLAEKGMFRQVYKELNKMNGEILNSDKVREDTERTRREWISNITHDLKTPLSPVRGYGELLADNPVADSETIREYGKIILKNVSHAEKLINDLKLTWQLESGVIPYQPEDLPLIRCLREVMIDLINAPAFQNRSLELESSLEELTVCIDRDLFRRAIENLLINALTHNPPETKIKVLVNPERSDKVKVVVRDNGTGMSSEEQSELFQRYYRGTNTKEKPEGSGLGLAIAKEIVTLHRGDISVKSKLNEGTEFVISLPVKM